MKIRQVEATNGDVLTILTEETVTLSWFGIGHDTPATSFKLSPAEVRTMLEDAITALNLADKAMGVGR